MITSQTTVLEVGGLHWATSAPTIEKTLLPRQGVLAVRANATSPMSSSAAWPRMTCSHLWRLWSGSRRIHSPGPVALRVAESGVPVHLACDFRNVAGHGAIATVQGRRAVVGNRRLMTQENVGLGDLGQVRDELAAAGRTAVLAAVDGRAVAVITLADAPRETAAMAVDALHKQDIEDAMLTGDNEATARRIADHLGIDTVIAEVLPGAEKVAELQRAGKGLPWWATA